MAAASAVFTAPRALAAERSRLAVVSGSNYERMLKRGLELCGWLEKFLPGSWVVVKPNASFANPADWGNNTNPELVADLCRLLKRLGARRITVADYPLFGGAEALEANGIAAACRESGAELVVLSSERQFRNLTVPGGEALKQVAVCREVLDADFLINVPVAKAHDAVAASIGLKNLMGVIWDRTVFHTQLEINQAICDLARTVRPQLTIVDMTRVMVTNGPKGPGKVESPGLVALSTDPVAADAYAVSQLAFNGRRLKPRQLKYLRLAAEAGLGAIESDQVEMIKEAV